MTDDLESTYEVTHLTTTFDEAVDLARSALTLGMSFRLEDRWHVDGVDADELTTESCTFAVVVSGELRYVEDDEIETHSDRNGHTT